MSARSAVAVRSVSLLVLAFLLELGCLFTADPARGAVLTGVVEDSASARPIAVASVRLDNEGQVTVTAGDGSYEVRGIGAGLHKLTVRHVAYMPAVRWVHVPEDAAAIAVPRIRLVPRELRLDPMDVRADRVSPLTSGDASRILLTRRVMSRLSIDDAAEAISLIPGVVMSGDRAFFRGLGFEQILPTVDGVSVREPIRGAWILPPPEAIGAVELTGGSFEAEHGQALAGVYAIGIPDGGREHQGRVSVLTDRLSLPAGTTTRSDRVDLGASGPLSSPSLFYSLAVQMRLSDTHLAYAHERPEQRLFGLDLGDHMAGTESAMARLAWKAPDRSWSANLTLLHGREKVRPYHDHFSRVGRVGWNPLYDRYTTYLEGPADADSAVMNNAPARVAVRASGSDLGIATMTHSLGGSADGRIHLRLARHRYIAGPEDGQLDDLPSITEWLRTSTTRPNHQEEPFYSTHGDYPDYEDGESREAEIGARVRVNAGAAHRVGIGAGATVGSHRFLGVQPGAYVPYGSLDERMRTVDAHAYAQDTWYSDRLSSMTLGLRWDYRAIRGFPASVSAATVSPRLGFCQPMTDLDMFHVQIGLLYQFPTLQERFLWSPAGQPWWSPPDFHAQRTRAFEVGLQHHFSKTLVAYFGAYARESSEVIFAVGDPSDADAIHRSDSRPGPQAIQAYGFTVIADHQLHPAVNGQVRGEIGRSSREDIEAPWSRAAQIGGWLFLRPLRPLDLSLSWIWDSGAPYDICLKPKGCTQGQRYRGRLPDLFETDLAANFDLRGSEAGRRCAIVLEVRNVFDRRSPAFDFGVAAAQVGVSNFIAYYDRTGSAGGYVLDLGDQLRVVPIDNPETRRAGRTIRLGLQVDAF